MKGIGWWAVVILLLLGLWQNDRLWERVQRLEREVVELQRDLADIHRQVSRTAALLGGRIPAIETRREEHAPQGEGEGAFARAAAVQRLPEYAPGDWLVRALPTGIATLTPFVSTDAYSAEVQGYVLESLLTRDPETLAWQGLLADRWEVSEDGLSVLYWLRPEARFADGSPVTAEDVVFTVQFLLDERIATPRVRAYLQRVEHVEAVDRYRVRFRLREPYFDVLSLTGGLAILSKGFYGRFLENPQAFNQSRGLLFGSGPYRLRDPEQWRPDLGWVELERNPRYWGPVQPPFARLVWRVITNETARLTAFRNGEIDLYSARPIEYARLREDKRLQERATRFEFLAPTAGYTFVAWNPRRGDRPSPFADRRVRRALTLLTDRERIVREIYYGFAEPAVSPFSPRSPQHDPEIVPEPYDVEEALSLLGEAGWRRRPEDGVLVNEAGEVFRFRLTFFQDNEDARRLVLLLRDLYAQAGIVVEPDPTEWSVMLERLNQKRFEAITLGWTSGVEVDLFQVFHSSQAGNGGDNFVSFADETFDRLVEAARREVNEERRMALWRAAERILVAEQPYTFLVRRMSLVFVDRRLAHVQTTRLGLNVGFVPIEVFVPAPLQRYREGG